MELDSALESRHSVRAFSEDPVPADALDRMFEAASKAPSSFNEQPWRFYAARGQSRDRVIDVMAQSTQYLDEYLRVSGRDVTESAVKWYTELGGAPVFVACTMPRVDDEFEKLNKLLAIGGAMEHLMLAATQEGLGTCAVTFSYWVNDELSEVLSIPRDRIIVGMVAVGYSAGEPETPEKSHDVVVYLD